VCVSSECLRVRLHDNSQAYLMRAWSRSRKSLAAVRALRSSRLAPAEPEAREDDVGGVSSSEDDELANEGDNSDPESGIYERDDGGGASTSYRPSADQKYVSRYHEKKSRIKFKTLATVVKCFADDGASQRPKAAEKVDIGRLLPTTFDSDEANQLREQAKKLHERDGATNEADTFYFAAKGPATVERSFQNWPWAVLIVLISLSGLVFLILSALNGFDAVKSFAESNQTHIIVEVYDSLYIVMLGSLVTAVFSLTALNLSSSRIFVQMSPFVAIFLITLAYVYFGVRLFFGGNWGILEGSALYISNTIKAT